MVIKPLPCLSLCRQIKARVLLERWSTLEDLEPR